MKTSSRSKRITIKDFYQGYTYKKNPNYSNTIPDPYVKQKDVTDHKYSLTYAEWLPIVEDYLECAAEVLTEGNRIKLPHNLGEFVLMKMKCRRFLDYVKSKDQGQQVYHAINSYDNYVLKLKWVRDIRTAIFPFKWSWHLDSTRELLLRGYKKCDKDYTHIYKFIDFKK
jgi:hypothetical protein